MKRLKILGLVAFFSGLLNLVLNSVSFSSKNDLNILNNWKLIAENEKKEKLFYNESSVKIKTPSKTEIELLYLPSNDIAQRCEDYWMNWFLMNEFREVMWIGIPEKEKAKCRSLKYGIYRWIIDCKNKTYKEIDYFWYDEKENPIYTRKNTGISFLFIPKDLIENFPFDKFCKDNN